MILNNDNYKIVIDSKKVKFGVNVHFGDGTKITGVDGPAEYVEIGDNVFLDSNIFVMTPEFRIGDYSKVYKSCRISGYKPCIIGHNFWCDQNTILNCTDTLTIGNNVGIGAYSQLWTHIKHGDVLEGCRFNMTKPMIIGDDVWFVGHSIVSPIKAGNKSMLLVGSVITKDMEENHIYGGSPAKDLTDKLGNQFNIRTSEEKMKIMESKLQDFLELVNDDVYKSIRIVEEFPANLYDGVSYFNINSRTYTKNLTEIEMKFMKYLLPLIKFTPRI